MPTNDRLDHVSELRVESYVCPFQMYRFLAKGLTSDENTPLIRFSLEDRPIIA